jgi:cytochrome c-type biogenesis protein CcmH
MLQDSIAEAYAAIGKTAPTSVGKDPSPAGPKTHASVRGQVELDAALKARAAPGDTVMVIARVPGARVPVAVVRAKLTELPLPFVLDDSLAMSAQSKISMADQVEVEARISKSGMAQPESGDLVSAVQTVKVGATGISIRVTKVRP